MLGRRGGNDERRGAPDERRGPRNERRHPRDERRHPPTGDGTTPRPADVAPRRGAEAHGIYLGAGAGGPIEAGAERAVLVLGPPRSGKTSALIVPNVLVAPGPVVSTSTKSDVLDATSAARGARGQCWLYDPSGTVTAPDGMRTLRWSPVVAAATWDGALLMARAMVRSARPAEGVVDASHWTERAEALLAPLLLAAHRCGEGVDTVVRWVNRHEATAAIAILRDAGAATAEDLLSGIAATEDRELSGIWSTASGVLAGYRSDSALACAGDPNFDPARFVRSSQTVYICASGRHQELVAPMIVGLLEDIRAAAYDAARRGAMTPPVLLALDEVANVAPLPDLPAVVSEGGSQGVLTLACLQDLSQARARWGDAAEGFGSLFGVTVVLRGIGDVRTLRAVSEQCGEMDVVVRSATRGRAGRRLWRQQRSRSVNWSTRRQPRLDVDEVAQGRDGSALLLGGGRAPAWVVLTPWWACEPWRSWAHAKESGRADPASTSRSRSRREEGPARGR